MAGGRAVWLLEKTRRHMGRKSRDLGGKRCRLFAALACSVGDKAAAGVMGAEAVLAESSAMFTDRGAS